MHFRHYYNLLCAGDLFRFWWRTQGVVSYQPSAFSYHVGVFLLPPEGCRLKARVLSRRRVRRGQKSEIKSHDEEHLHFALDRRPEEW
jgi:hypothetical protein